MSRVAKEPVELPKGVEFKQDGNVVTLKGGNGELSIELNSEVELKQEDNVLTLAPRSGSRFSTAIAGTMRAIIANMAKGVSEGFEKKLELKGVGYRAQAQGKKPESVARVSRTRSYTRRPRASRSRRRARPRSWSRALTSRRLARPLPRFAASVRRSPTRARAFAIPMSVYSSRKRRRNN